MKTLVTPEKIRFIYFFYSIETSDKNINYFFVPKKVKKVKWDVNIDILGINDMVLRIKLDNRKITSILGSWFGYVAYFFNRIFLRMKMNNDGDLYNVLLNSFDDDVSIFGKKKISDFLQELKANNYSVENIILDFNNCSK